MYIGERCPLIMVNRIGTNSRTANSLWPFYLIFCFASFEYSGSMASVSVVSCPPATTVRLPSLGLGKCLGRDRSAVMQLVAEVPRFGTTLVKVGASS